MTPNPLLGTDPTPAKTVPPLPVDPGLPQLAQILDAQVMQVALRAAGVSGVEETRPRYLRYKPSNKAIVLYDVCLSGQWTRAVVTASARRNLAKLCHAPYVIELAELTRRRTATGTPVMFLNSLGALVEWFPLNRLIPGLALPPAQLSALIAGSPHGKTQAGEPVPLAYKPERRAVSRWGDLILKAYARHSDFDQAVRGFAAGRGVPNLTVPALVDAIPESRVTLQMAIAGSIPDGDHAEHLGRALAMLHAAPPASPFHTTAEDHLAAAVETCLHVRLLLPRVRYEAERLIGRLRTEIPDPYPPVQSHGDFHGDQALVQDGQLALIDFDHACVAHPALDLATFAAHLVDGTEASVDGALGAVDGLLRGYGEPPKDLDWFLAVAILRRALFPFRSLAADWPARVVGLLRAVAALVPSRPRTAAL